MERRELGLPPDKVCQATGDCGLQASAHPTRPDQLEHLHRLRQPLDRHRSQGVDLHQAFDQPQRRHCQPNAPRRGQLLHARRQVGGLAHGGVVHVQVVADRADHHLAGVEPDPDAHLQAVGATDLLGIVPQGGLHRQSGVTGAQGVILMGDGSAKEGHDAIAQHLVDRAS